MWELVAAFLIAVAIGLPSGLIIGLQRFAYRSFHPIVLLLYAIPQATILPLVVLVVRHRTGVEDRVRRRPTPSFRSS